MTPKKSSKLKIRFPRDEGAHPAFIVEWWYGHFSLADSGGREYGAMVAYFNFGLKILAISDLGTDKLHHFVSGSPTRCSEGNLDLRWGRDHWFHGESNSPHYQLESYGSGLGLNLSLDSEKTPLPVCGRGLVKWTGGDSYYYSLTRLKAKGQIELEGRKLAVEGIGWMDHQWMNPLGGGGWDWFAVQLDDNTDIVLWHIVNPDEKVESRDLTIMFADNRVYHTRNIKLEKIDSWVSPQSSKEYGTLWRVRAKAHGLDLKIKARHAQQEIRMFETLSIPSFHFWEGRTSVSGNLDGKSVSGVGYAEFVRFSRG